MTTFVGTIERENTITIDGYTSNKTTKGIIKDVARVVRQYSEIEADTLLSYLNEPIDEYNTPFLKADDSDGGYFFEIDWMYDNVTYFLIRIVK